MPNSFSQAGAVVRIAGVTHQSLSAITPPADNGKIRPPEWNDDHVITGGTHGQVMMRDTTQATGFSWAGAPTTGFIGAAVFPSSTFTVDNITFTVVPFGLESFDSDNFHDNSVNNSRLTIPVGLGGKYLITGMFDWDNNTSGERLLSIYKNGAGSSFGRARNAAHANLGQNVQIILDLVPGDYIELAVYQSSGGTRTVPEASSSAGLQIVKLDSGKIGTGIGAKVINSTTQNITTSSTDKLTFDTEHFDTDNFHSTSTNTTRLTIPAGLGGKYLVIGATKVPPNGTGQRILAIFKNGATIGGHQSQTASGSINQRMSVSAILDLAATEYVELYLFQDSGSTLAIGDATLDLSSQFSIMRLDSGSAGIPSGGTTGQYLVKSSAADYAYTWANPVVGFIGASVYASANQTVNNSDLLFDTENFDTDGFHSTSVDTGRMTIPAGLGGKYLVTATAYISTANALDFRFFVNGSQQRLWAQGTIGTGAVSITGVVDLTAGDYVTANCYTAGNNRTMLGQSGGFASAFEIVKLDSGKVGTGIGARATRTTDQTGIITSTDTAVIFNSSESFDTDNFHSTSVNPERMTIPAGLGGKYLLTASVTFDTNSTGYRQIWFRQSVGSGGANGFTRVPANASYPALSSSTVLDLVAGEYVEVIAWQDSLGNRTLTGTVAGMSFSIMRLDSGGTSIQAGNLLASTFYKPAAQQSLNTSSTTIVDVDATNLAVTFTAPPSGAVTVVCEASIYSTQGWAEFGIRESTTVLRAGRVMATHAGSGAQTRRFRITGLTPGSSHTYKFGYSASNGGGTVNIYIRDDDATVDAGGVGAASIEVYAA